MVSRKQWVHWKYEEDATLRETLVEALPPNSPGKVKAVLKDAHLLEAAAATGQRIVSKDKTARDLFRLACPALESHRHILWGDMTLTPDAVVGWIKLGCPGRNDYKLCLDPPRKSKKRMGKSK